jgi:signal transduction histidine kinase
VNGKPAFHGNIGREALTNAIHHGRASDVRMGLEYGETSLLLKVSDNGEGFDPGAVRAPDGHCGLTSMKERAEAVGGTLKIRSAPGRGTHVEATVPKHSGT